MDKNKLKLIKAWKRCLQALKDFPTTPEQHWSDLQRGDISFRGRCDTFQQVFQAAHRCGLVEHKCNGAFYPYHSSFWIKPDEIVRIKPGTKMPSSDEKMKPQTGTDTDGNGNGKGQSMPVKKDRVSRKTKLQVLLQYSPKQRSEALELINIIAREMEAEESEQIGQHFHHTGRRNYHSLQLRGIERLHERLIMEF